MQAGAAAVQLSPQAPSPAAGLDQGSSPNGGWRRSRPVSGASASGDVGSVGADEVKSGAQRKVMAADARGTLSLRSTVFAVPPPKPPAQPELHQAAMRQLIDEEKAWEREHNVAPPRSAQRWVPPHKDHPTPSFADERPLPNPVSVRGRRWGRPRRAGPHSAPRRRAWRPETVASGSWAQASALRARTSRRRRALWRGIRRTRFHRCAATLPARSARTH